MRQARSSAIVLLLLGSGSTQAFAQASEANTAPAVQAANAPDTADIIVTAQKRSERLNDVPISITAATGDQLAKQGVSSPADLAKIVPGFTYQRSSFGAPVFTIRGIGLYDTSVGIAPTVSVYVDQVPLPYLVMTPAASLDIERVEVLKGPQGTLFGQNSTGGAINYIAAKPTKDPHMGFDLTYGRFNEIDTQGFVSGPITSTLRVRIAARHEYQDGWQQSETRPGDRLGARDFSAGRVLVDWDASDRLKVELSANGWRDHSETQASQFIGFRASRPLSSGGYPESTLAIGFRAAAPDKARIADWDPGVSFRRNDSQYQFSGRADYNLSDRVTLTSITSYAHYKALTPSDNDGTSFDNFRHTTDAKISTFSQELRASIDLDWLKLTAGGNYQNDHTDEADINTYVGSNSGIGPIRYSNFANIANQQVKTYAGFANADFNVTRTLSFQVGARYTQQDRNFEGCLADGGDGALAATIALLPASAGLPYSPGPAGGCVTLNAATLSRLPIVTDSLNQHNVSWRGGLKWQPSSNLLVYGNVTRGFKAGSFTPLPAIFATQLTPVTQEQVTAYEIGSKASLFNRLLSISGAAFYYDYRNKQILGSAIFPQFGALPQLQNIPNSSVRGAEIELTLRPMQGLRITGGATYVRSRVEESYISSSPFGTLLDLKGEAFPNTPRWQAVGDAEYDFPLSNSLKAFIGSNISYRSSSNAAFGNDPTFRFKPYTLVDMRAGVGSADDRWRVEVWGKNVFNTFYWTNVAYYIDSISRTTGLPATYGVTLRTRF